MHFLLVLVLGFVMLFFISWGIDFLKDKLYVWGLGFLSIGFLMWAFPAMVLNLFAGITNHIWMFIPMSYLVLVGFVLLVKGIDKVLNNS